MTIILNITTQDKWQHALACGEFRADSLESEGFIHCSTVDQVLRPANEFYAGQTGLVLLTVETAKLSSTWVYEDRYDTGQKFPHIYGSIDLDAVTGVIEFPPNSDGTFSLPPELA